jgi:hypothetical protein
MCGRITCFIGTRNRTAHNIECRRCPAQSRYCLTCLKQNAAWRQCFRLSLCRCASAAPPQHCDHPFGFLTHLAVRGTDLTARVPCAGSSFERSNLVVDRSTTGLNSGPFGGLSVDGRPVQRTRQDTVDELNHLAKVRVAGSNPVFRSNEVPGRGLLLSPGLSPHLHVGVHPSPVS